MLIRTFVALIAFVCTLSWLPVSAQMTRPPTTGEEVAKPTRMFTLPAAHLPTDDQSRLRHLRSLSSTSDSLTHEQLARRVARIYRYQSEFLEAEVSGEPGLAEDLLNRAIQELRLVAQRPGVMEQVRFREVYRSVVSEYERYYGVSDSLSIEQGDIFEFRAAMFAALDRLTDPLLEDVLLPEIRPMRTVFPMEVNRLVQQSIDYLVRSPERHLYNWLARAETYFPMIEQILAEEGVPDELKYLALIESGLNPRARSWAGAVGMWQFMPATGRVYGLHVNHWVDERQDPEKATRAAARHLRDLYEMFGDWQLALAGYNWGAGGVLRAIRRTEPSLGRKPTFWEIYNVIPRETRNYVPMFIATALVASNPEAFKLTPSRSGPRYEYDLVPAPGMMDLSRIASLAGTDVATIRALNPEIRTSTTPPANGPYMIRIPFGAHSQFVAELAKLPKSEQGGNTHYVVRRGDTLGRIARQYGVTVAALQRTNSLRGTTIHPGQSLIVPVPRYDSGFADQLASAGALQVQYGNHTRRPIEIGAINELASAGPSAPASAVDQGTVRTVSTAAPAPAPETTTSYRVRRGDTLGAIARQHGVTVNQLRQWNNIRGSRIIAGQRLTIHARGSAASSQTAAAQVYTVRRGDTLSTIARRHGVTVSQLRTWNSLRSDRINIGQRLRVNG